MMTTTTTELAASISTMAEPRGNQGKRSSLRRFGSRQSLLQNMAEFPSSIPLYLTDPTPSI
uniref:Uncharacterized protein n=1 Tax=Anguilla anguilla TaxID=7936 RepID=A0A0E9XKJ1_ANGAN